MSMYANRCSPLLLSTASSKKLKKDIPKEKEKDVKEKEKDKQISITSSPRRNNKQAPVASSESVVTEQDKLKVCQCNVWFVPALSCVHMGTLKHACVHYCTHPLMRT